MFVITLSIFSWCSLIYYLVSWIVTPLSESRSFTNLNYFQLPVFRTSREHLYRDHDTCFCLIDIFIIIMMPFL